MLVYQVRDAKLLEELVHFAGVVQPLLNLVEPLWVFLRSLHDGFDFFERDLGDADAANDDLARHDR